MRISDSPFLSDWFAISIRWIILIGLALSLGLQKPLNLTMTILLALPTLWCALVSMLAIFNQRMRSHRIVNLAVDMLFSVLLFIFSGDIHGPVLWVAILPIAISSIYYEIRGAFLVTLLVTLAQVGYIFFRLPFESLLLPVATVLGFNCLTAIGATLVTSPFLRRLRTTYQSQLNQRKESERKAQKLERDRMRALFEMIETFSATLNYQAVLETALDSGIQALGLRDSEAEQIVGAVLLFGGDDLEIKTSRHFYQSDATTTLPAEKGVLYETLKTGESHLVQDPFKDPELNHLTTLDKCPVALCLPLMRGMNAYGVMLFAHTNPDFFIPERVEILQMINNQAVIALQNARLYQDLAKEKERIVQTQEEAQKKLARDLHDGPTQSVSAIAMRLNIARKMIELSVKEKGGLNGNVKELTDELVRIEDLARRTTQEIRHMLFTLRPLVLESEGLAAALQTMADKMRDLYQQNVVIDVDPAVVQQLDAARQTVVFYLSEEAVNNARKHANAQEIAVRLKHFPKDTCIAILEIADNGAGFDVKTVLGSYDRRGSLGMVNLRERTELINGRMSIDSAPGKGTRVRVFIPLSEEAADRLNQGK